MRKKVFRVVAVLLGVIIVGFFAVPFILSGIYNGQLSRISREKFTLPTDFVLPDSRIIAVGSATHGNAEPYEVTLELLKKVYYEHGSTAFILEENVGAAEIINECHSFLDENGRKLGFYTIYDNKEMDSILLWLKQSNQRLYGIDIQTISTIVSLLNDDLDTLGFPDISKIPNLPVYKDYEIKQNLPLLKEIEDFLLAKKNINMITEQKYCYLSHLVDCIRMNYDYISSGSSFEVRDEAMAKNTEWVMEYEREFYNNDYAVLLASNGHVMKSNLDEKFSGRSYKTLGVYLDYAYDDEYYVILTDANENYFMADHNRNAQLNITTCHVVSSTPPTLFGNSGYNYVFFDEEKLISNEIDTWNLTVIGHSWMWWWAINMDYKYQISLPEASDALLFFEYMTPMNYNNRQIYVSH